MPDNIWNNVPNNIRNMCLMIFGTMFQIISEYYKRNQEHKISSTLFLTSHTKYVPDDNTLLLGTLFLLEFSVLAKIDG